ncbi:MAG: discoidin domain-containing protein [Clostridia bacterium]|nr:discoidin domain-containing protein [Clostridia bacterium]
MKRLLILMVVSILLAGIIFPSAVCATEDSLTEIDYDPNAITMYTYEESGVQPLWTPVPEGVTDGSYLLDCLNDGVYTRPSFAQIEFLGVHYLETGYLNKAFYIRIDLGKVYDLDKLSITWFTNRGVNYCVYGSEDGSDYNFFDDQSETEDGTMYTESVFDEDARARYIEIEILGLTRHDDGLGGEKNFFAMYEIDVYGTEAGKNQQQLLRKRLLLHPRKLLRLK